MFSGGPYANPDTHPGLRDALKNCENAAYTNLIKWRDMYENVSPGKHITGMFHRKKKSYKKRPFSKLRELAIGRLQQTH